MKELYNKTKYIVLALIMIIAFGTVIYKTDIHTEKLAIIVFGLILLLYAKTIWILWKRKIIIEGYSFELFNLIICGVGICFAILLLSGDNYDNYYLMVGTLIYGCIIFFNKMFIEIMYLKEEYHWIFCKIGLFLCLIYVFIIPINVTPDETVHVYDAFYVSDLELGYDVKSCDNVLIRDCEKEINEVEPYIDRNVYNNYFQAMFNKVNDDGENIVDSGIPIKKITHPTGVYFVSSLGITIGRLLHMNGIRTVMLGMLFNLLFFVGFATYSIKRIPFGKILILVMSLLPITLQEVASLSYDNLVMTATIVVISLSLYWKYDSNMVVRWYDVLIFGLASISLAFVKGGVYAIFILLAIVLCSTKEYWKSLVKNKNFKWMVLFVIILLLIIFRNVYLPHEVEVVEGYENYMEWADQEGFTVIGLLKNIPLLIFILVNTFIGQIDFYILSGFGQSLGWFQINIPYYVIGLYILVFLLACQNKGELAKKMSGMDKTILIVFSVISGGLCAVAMLFGWTPCSFNYIAGVQGRYLWPGIMACGFTLSSRNILIKKNIDRELISVILILSYLTIMYILRFSV